MLYSQTIKNLVSGISQQPPILRLPEQLAQQINGFSTEVSGLQKRPPTCHVSFLNFDTVTGIKPLLHFVNRDQQERYLFAFNGENLYISDLAGKSRKVTIAEDAEYLKTDNPHRDLRIITIADYTFITNRKVKVKMSGAKSPDSFHTQGALIHVKQGQYGRTYAVWINDVLVASHTTPDGSSASHTHAIDTSVIAAELGNQLKAKGYTADVGDCWVRAQGNSLRVATSDGFNNQAMIGITTTVQKFSLLPATAPDGYTVRVTGDPNNSAGSYYVRFDKENRIWKETCRPDIETAFDPATMPHVLVREVDGSFTFRRASWGERSVGDNDSNPLPSFVGEVINDIFFYRNRLGFLAGENVILSESAEYFNFWMSTANDVQDTDPIDVSTTTNRINILNYAVPFNEELYCFSESTQFILRSDTTLSPKNVALVNSTGFNSAPGCRPVVCGKNLYFPSARSEYTTIKEYYYVPSATDMRNAQDITSHVASYIPNHVYEIIPSTNENLMLCLTDGESSAIYVYKYLFQNENRVQASWSKWDMGADILGAAFLSNVLYLVLYRPEKGFSLEKMNFTYDTEDMEKEPYRAYLDCKAYVPSAVYDPVTEMTTLDVKDFWPLIIADHACTGFLLPDGTYKEVKAEEAKTAGKIQLSGKHDTEPIIMGFPYTFLIVFSPLYLRKQDNTGTLRAITNGRLQIRTIKLNYANTGGFIVHVKSRGHIYQYTMTGKNLGTTKLNALQLTTGIFRIPVQAENTAYEMTVESNLPLPMSLIGFLWEGSFMEKSKGV